MNRWKRFLKRERSDSYFTSFAMTSVYRVLIRKKGLIFGETENQPFLIIILPNIKKRRINIRRTCCFKPNLVMQYCGYLNEFKRCKFLMLDGFVLCQFLSAVTDQPCIWNETEENVRPTLFLSRV
jgi:hypothetical protein